jgi:hypothetical protein
MQEQFYGDTQGQNISAHAKPGRVQHDVSGGLLQLAMVFVPSGGSGVVCGVIAGGGGFVVVVRTRAGDGRQRPTRALVAYACHYCAHAGAVWQWDYPVRQIAERASRCLQQRFQECPS